jgi:hypothetical protein
MRAIAALCSFLLLLCSDALEAQSYFQQRVDYRIAVELDDINHRLIASMEMDYQNNSPNDLDTIYIHLWPNAYSARNTDLGEKLRKSGDFNLEFSKASERGYISDIEFTVDGEAVQHHEFDGQTDIAYLVLKNPLPSGQKITLKTPFEVKIPVGKFSRLGHIGQSYQITQWYPKPAVYDMEGWHPLTYLSQGEFYSEYGSFDVSITVPTNYVVAATGELQSEEELEFLRHIAHETSSRAIQRGRSNEFPPSDTQKKTIVFTQDKVHDFAWFADKRFNILHEEFELEGSGKKVEGWVYFTNNHHEAWAKSMEYVIDGTKHYSRLVGDYPYDHVSVVDGTLSAGGGMEYPMITVVNGTSNNRSLERVIVHEIGHNWFYGILGSNERAYAWMDEGINSYYEYRYFKEKYPPSEAGKGRLINYLDGSGYNLEELAYRYSACRHQDQALSTTSSGFSPLNYGTMVYAKGAKIMDQLSSVLGQEEYDRIMHQYFEDWKFRHPGPSDMKESLEKASGQQLDWFFEDLARDNVKVNHRICCLNKEKASVTVISKTSYQGPLAVGFMKDGKVVDTVIGSGKKFEVKTSQDFDAVLIDPEQKSLQINRRNDLIRSKGILKTWQLPEVRALIGSGMDERTKLYVAPAIAWNEQDRFMLGGYFSNTEILFKDFEWTAVPMYSADRNQLVGTAKLRKTFWTNELGPGRVDISVGAKRFSLDEFNAADSRYTALESKLIYDYQDPSYHRGRHRVTLEVDYIDFNTELGSEAIPLLLRDRQDVYTEIRYDFDKQLGLTTSHLGLGLEVHEDYQKVALEANVKQIYNADKKKVKLRLYAGKMWPASDELIPLGARLNISGTSGSQIIDYTSDDYRYEYLFINRSVVQSSRPSQIVRDRGGFMQVSPYGSSDNWLASVNTEADIPVSLPISVYASLGTYAVGDSGSEFLYETGARINLIEDFCDISFPLFQSEVISDYYTDFDVKYIETIRFQLRFELLTFRELIDNIRL